MNLVELRQNLKNYKARREAFYLAKNLNQKPSISLAEIEENASDLFSLSTVESLKNLIETSTDAHETERKARQNLLDVSRLGFLKNYTREISEEVENCQNSVRVKFQNENLNAQQVLEKIELLPEAASRQELFVRLLDAKNSCADLQAEKFTQLREKLKTLGFENPRKFHEEINGVDFDDFARKAQGFLERTERIYFQMLSENALNSGLDEKSLRAADFLYFQKKLEHEEIFSAENLPRLYAKILENFNFSEYKISNIRVKTVSANSQTGVFCPNLPEEVYFCVANCGGVSNYTELLRAFGKANFAAWTSKEIANRHPEFVFSPDNVLPNAYGFLFQTLLAEEAFLRKDLNVWDEKLLNRIKYENEFRILFEMRRNVLRFVLETQIYSAIGNFQEICETFAEIFTNNLGFRFEKQQIQWEATENFSPVKNLRAVLFAFGLREYFRGKYGFDWWRRRKAFEELIDFWNTAQRYKTEEMAQMIGFEMSFDLLAENFKTRKS